MALTLLVVSASLFVFSHIALSSLPAKAFLARRFGEGGSKLFYALVSLLTLGLAIFAYAGLGARGPVLFAPLGRTSAPVWILMVLSFLFLAYSMATPSPVGADMGAPSSSTAKGMLRVTSHPQNMGMLCFGLAHVLVTGTLGALFLYGSFVVLPSLGAWHETAKTRRKEGAEIQAFLKETGVIPFAAIIAGRNRLVLSEFAPAPLIGALLGLGISFGLHILLG